MSMRIFRVGLIIVSVMIVTSTVLNISTVVQASSKGLKLYLTVNSNQGSQDGTIQTSQYGKVVDTRLRYITQGNYQYELRYQKGQVDNGDFHICVMLNNGVNNYSTGYNGPEKKPVYVHVNLHGETNDNTESQSQAQSSNNENNNNNALSQSQNKRQRFTSVKREVVQNND